jgi:hypothetical protein
MSEAMCYNPRSILAAHVTMVAYLGSMDCCQTLIVIGKEENKILMIVGRFSSGKENDK